MTNIIKIDWQPQERQLACLKACGLSQPFDDNLELRPAGSAGEEFKPAVADIIGYGGSAGGGKTDTLLAVAIVAAVTYPGINIGYFRREFPQLEGPGGAIMRSRELIGHFAKYNEQKKRWLIPTNKKDSNGNQVFSVLQFCHCANGADVYNYQSQQFDILLIDEVTQFEKEMTKYLLTRNRATVTDDNFKPFACFGTNPGNIGHQYFKDEFVTLGIPEQVSVFVNESGEKELHIYIPSKLSDNQILEKRDPRYRTRISSTELNRKMLLEGDWDVFAGQAFGELNRDKHLTDDFELPKHWRFFGAYDQGFNHPFSFGIFAVDTEGNVYLVSRATSRLKRIDEVARMMEAVAQKIGGLSKLDYIVAGWDCWLRGRDGGVSVAEQFLKSTPKILLRRASEDRLQAVSQIRDYIAWKQKKVDDQGKLVDVEPRFKIFQSCSGVYDVMARMIFDTNGPRPEDVLKVDADENGQGGDDDYDMVRYALMSRPRKGQINKPKAPTNSVMGYIQKKQRERWIADNYV